MAKTWTVSCEVRYRRVWERVEAETREEAQKIIFNAADDFNCESELISGPGGPDDMEAVEDGYIEDISHA